MSKKPFFIETIFKNAWNLYKKNIGMLLLIVLLGILLAMVFIIPGSIALIVGLGGFAAKEIVFNAFTIAGMVIFAVAIILGMVVSLVYNIALVKGIATIDKGQTIKLREVFQFGYQKLWPVLLASSLAGLMILGGFILLIIPGIILAIYFQFVLYAVIFENKVGSAALRRSYDLVRGKFWWVVLVMLMVIVLQSGLGVIPFVGSAIAFLLTPFWQCITYFLYKELVAIKK